MMRTTSRRPPASIYSIILLRSCPSVAQKSYNFQEKTSVMMVRLLQPLSLAVISHGFVLVSLHRLSRIEQRMYIACHTGSSRLWCGVQEPRSKLRPAKGPSTLRREVGMIAIISCWRSRLPGVVCATGSSKLILGQNIADLLIPGIGCSLR